MTKMTKKSLICPKCREKLDSYGWQCLDLVEEICVGNGVFADPFYYRESIKQTAFMKMVKFLEQKRYIVTTDVDHKTYAFPNLRHGDYDYDTELFCWCNMLPKVD